MTVFGVIKLPPKQPYDLRIYTIDCRPYVHKGDKLSGGIARVYPLGADPEITYLADMFYSFAYDPEKNQVEIGVQAGTTLTTYRIRIRVTTVAGERLELEAEFKVKEVR